MCLYVTNLKPKRVKFKNGKRIVYKVFAVGKKVLRSPYRGTINRIGENVAKGKFALHNSDFGEVVREGAIHVYNTLKSAQNAGWTLKVAIVPVTVYEKDFLAEGIGGEVCFSKIFISEEDYKKALEG